MFWVFLAYCCAVDSVLGISMALLVGCRTQIKPTLSYYDFFPYYSLGPSLAQCQRKGIFTHNHTHTWRTKIPRNATQCLITQASGCLLWFLSLFSFCVSVDGKLDHVLQHKTSELQTDLALTETKPSWCMFTQSTEIQRNFTLSAPELSRWFTDV